MSKFLDLRKNGFFFFFFNLFGNSLYVLIHMFMHSVLKCFRCNFRNKPCNWVTNRKSMKLDFAILRIEEKTILHIKNLLTLFISPDESLWHGVSMNWVPVRVLMWKESSPAVWVLGAPGTGFGAALLDFIPIHSHRWFDDWQVLSVSQMLAPHTLHLTDPKYDGSRQCFKVRRPGWLLPQSSCLFLLCSSGSQSCVHVALWIVPAGKWDELYFFFLSLLHLWDLSVRSSVFCLILYIVIYWYCKSNPGNYNLIPF